MNPVVLYFASGESLYAGAGLILLAIAVSQYIEQSWLLRLRNLAAWLGLALMVMASPPFSWTVDAIFLTAFVLWLAVSNQWLEWGATNSRKVATGFLMIVLVTLTAVEFSHRRMPVIVGVPADHLVVIGDSISSGIDPRVPAWPIVMQQQTDIPVKNLSRPGAQAIEGTDMAEKVTRDDRVVLIEIGGNDLLGGVPSAAFEKNLDATLSKLTIPGRTIVMFELPLLPHKTEYGEIQRHLASKYGVWLIPKRYFAEVIGGQTRLPTDCISPELVLTAWRHSYRRLFRECCYLKWKSHERL
jgi:acyl-CoA thioesterase I